MNEEMVVPGEDRADHIFKQFLAMHDLPSYMRRAREVEAELTSLRKHCEVQRDEWLSFVRIRIGTLRAMAGEWVVLRALLLDDEQIEVLQSLHRDLSPRLRVSLSRTSSSRRHRTALRELCESIELFNARWLPFVKDIDLSHLNELRERYNRFYVLEKECATRSPRLARHGFEPLAPLTTRDLLDLYPPLRVPRCAT